MKLAAVLPFLVCTGIAFPTTASANPDIRIVATSGLSHGGDAWVVAQAKDGSTVSISGGGNVEVGAGALWSAAQEPLAISLIAGYHYARSTGAHDAVQFSRVPLEAMAYYTGLETVRFGVGLSEDLSPAVKAVVDGTARTIRFANGSGKSFEMGYQVRRDLWTSLRLTSTSYKPKGAGAARAADVSAISLNLAQLF